MKSNQFGTFNVRLPEKQNLSESFIHSATVVAKELVEKHNFILATMQDQEIFFNAIMNPVSLVQSSKKPDYVTKPECNFPDGILTQRQ